EAIERGAQLVAEGRRGGDRQIAVERRRAPRGEQRLGGRAGPQLQTGKAEQAGREIRKEPIAVVGDQLALERDRLRDRGESLVDGGDRAPSQPEGGEGLRQQGQA